jgi:hypothetical protein
VPALAELEEPTPVDFNLTAFFKGRVTCQMTCEAPPVAELLNRPPYSIHNSGYAEGRHASLFANIISPTARAFVNDMQRLWYCVVAAAISHLCLGMTQPAHLVPFCRSCGWLSRV